jgi:NAD-dependent SIR2 family protein deacetylase
MVLQEDINLLKEKIEQADSIVVGGASGMSAASGFIFYYQEDDVFKSLAGSLAKKYNRHNMFDLFYDQRPSRGEQWALMLRTIKYVYECQTGETYIDLAKLLNGKNYYIATTNQDAQFYRVFPEERITRIQGDWRYWQCSRPCHDKIYYNKEETFKLYEKIENDALPDNLIPRCPHCGAELAPWVRSYTFLQGEFYRQEMKRYMEFLRSNAHRNTLFLELGVGMMTPMFIKEPFMNMVYQWPNAFYVTLNPQHAIIPKEIKKKSLAISDDIAITLKQLLGESTIGMKYLNV